MSDGATPDEGTPDAAAARKSIFGNSDDVASNPAPAARPATAAKRTEEARKKAGAPQDTASERLAAKKKETDKADEDVSTTGTVRVPTVESEIEPELDVDPRIEARRADRGAGQALRREPVCAARAARRYLHRLAKPGERPHLDVECQFQPRRRTCLAVGIDAPAQRHLRLGKRPDHDRRFVNFRKTIDGEEIDETRGGIKGVFERDLVQDWKALGSINYEIGPESASAPNSIEGTLQQPIMQAFAGSLGVEKDVGKLQLRLTGNVEREVFGDADLSTGGTVSQADRDTTLAGVVLRTGYEISPALTPFVELEYGQRFYDIDVDSNGFDRAATVAGARAGLELDLGEKLSGEFSGGWTNEDLADPRLASISAPTVNADLTWSPMRGTSVGLNALTTLEGATSPGESGSILYAGGITVERELRANLTADLGFAAALRDYTGLDGRDVILGAEVGATYWINRYLGLRGRARHEQLDSTLPNRDYKTNSVFVGLKLQR